MRRKMTISTSAPKPATSSADNNTAPQKPSTVVPIRPTSVYATNKPSI
jgi:hypothetical protein